MLLCCYVAMLLCCYVAMNMCDKGKWSESESGLNRKVVWLGKWRIWHALESGHVETSHIETSFPVGLSFSMMTIATTRKWSKSVWDDLNWVLSPLLRMNMCDKIYCFIIVYWKSYVGVTKESGLNRSSLRCPSSRTASQAWWNKAHLHTLFDTESTENTENTEDLKSRIYRLLEFIRCCYVLPETHCKSRWWWWRLLPKGRRPKG